MGVLPGLPSCGPTKFVGDHDADGAGGGDGAGDDDEI